TLVSLVPTSQQGKQPQLRVQRLRLTVTAAGPGLVGIDFYPARSLTPQRIAITAGDGDEPATSAAALLAELQSELPAGYTASADPENPAALLLDGSDGSPVFAAASANTALLTVSVAIPRIVNI